MAHISPLLTLHVPAVELIGRPDLLGLGNIGRFQNGVEVGTITGGLDRPYGMAMGGDGFLYAASGFGNEIVRLDAVTSAVAGSFASTQPRDIAFGIDGLLYVSSDFSDTIQRYNASVGVLVDTFVSDPGTDLFGFAFGPDSNLYVAASLTNEIRRYDGATGAFMDVFVTAGSGGLNVPISPVFGPDGQLYVSSQNTNNVLRYSGTTGVFLDVFAAGNLDTPRDLVFGADGDLYVAGLNSGNIVRYDGATGAYVTDFAASNAGFDPNFLLFTSPVPEPSQFVIVAIGTLLITLRHRRAAKVRPELSIALQFRDVDGYQPRSHGNATVGRLA